MLVKWARILKQRLSGGGGGTTAALKFNVTTNSQYITTLVVM